MACSKVVRAMSAYCKRIDKVKNFTVKSMIDFMEPVFKENGYRKIKSIDEKSSILIICDSGVGDFVLSSPVIKEIRRMYPNSFITLMVYTRAESLAINCPYVDEVIGYENLVAKKSLPDFLSETVQLAAEHLLNKYYDLCFIVGSDYFLSNMVAYLSGARRRIATVRNKLSLYKDITVEDYAQLITDKIDRDICGIHRVNQTLSLLDNFKGIPVEDRNLEVWCSEDDVESVDKVMQIMLSDYDELIIIGVGGYMLCKHLPIERYVELINKISRDNAKACFVIIGGPNDAKEAARIKELAETPCVYDFAGKISFTKSVAIMSRCSMYIGNDTSTLHIASALELPIVGIYSFPKNLINTTYTEKDYIKLYNMSKSIPSPVAYSPYNVPAVIILPPMAKDECNQPANSGYGCRRYDEPHCITDITGNHLYEGYVTLKEKIRNNEKTVVYL